MDVLKILADLRRERDQLDEAILTLERLMQGQGRRGRPPGWIKKQKELAALEVKGKGKRPASPKAAGNPPEQG